MRILISDKVDPFLLELLKSNKISYEYNLEDDEQEITFQYSDYVVLIREAEKKYYEQFGYTKYKAIRWG